MARTLKAEAPRLEAVGWDRWGPNPKGMLVGAIIERHALREVLSNRLRRMQNSRFRTDHGGASRGGVGTGGPSGRSGTTLGRRGERGVGPPRLLRAGADPWRGYRTGIAPATTGQS